MFQKKMVNTVIMILMLNFLFVVQTIQSQDSTYTPRKSPQTLELPDNVQIVLIHEMVTITRLMGNLLEYIVQGDATNASRTAVEIRDTNLKQEFSPKEIKEIMKFLPKEFIKMDRKFHMTANELAKVMDTNDFKSALNLYSDMTQRCLNCHTAFASKRFKNLKNK